MTTERKTSIDEIKTEEKEKKDNFLKSCQVLADKTKLFFSRMH